MILTLMTDGPGAGSFVMTLMSMITIPGLQTNFVASQLPYQCFVSINVRDYELVDPLALE